MSLTKAKIFLFTILVLSGVFFGFNRALALSLSPARIEINGNPGETIQKELLLINESDTIIGTYYSSYANFEASGDTGNPSFVEPKYDIDTWMEVPDAINLKPKEAKKVDLIIKIPTNAEPGGHFGAVFWGTSPNTPGSGVSIGAKTGVLVLLSVNGEVKESGGLVDFSVANNKFWHTTLPVSFTYRFKNDGGDRIKPAGKITMRNIVYLPSDKIDANPTSGNILPNSTRRFNVDWIKYERAKDYIAPTNKFSKFFDDALYEWRNFAFGPYFAKLNLLYGTEATRVTKTAFFFVFPWQLLICLIVILSLIYFGGKKLIKRYNRYIIQRAQAGKI